MAVVAVWEFHSVVPDLREVIIMQWIDSILKQFFNTIVPAFLTLSFESIFALWHHWRIAECKTYVIGKLGIGRNTS